MPSVVQSVYAEGYPSSGVNYVPLTIAGVTAGNLLVAVVSGIHQETGGRIGVKVRDITQSNTDFTVAITNYVSGQGSIGIGYLSNAIAGTHVMHIDIGGFTLGDFVATTLLEVAGAASPLSIDLGTNWSAYVNTGSTTQGTINTQTGALVIAGSMVAGGNPATIEAPFTTRHQDASGWYRHSAASYVAPGTPVTITVGV